MFALILFIFAIGALIRNEWVYNRMGELNRFEGKVHLIKQYASYDKMMLKFWIWNVEKFKLPKALDNK